MSSFPVPDSPRISTLASVGATSSICERIVFQSRALAKQAAEALIHFAPEIVVFLFELLLQRMDLFESPRVCNRDRGLIGEHSQPLEVLLVKRNAAECAENSQDLFSEDQRMAGKAVNALALHPGGIRSNAGIQNSIFDQERISGGSDLANLSYAERNTSESTLNAVPLLSIHLGAASAGRQVQAADTGGALAAHGTG